MTEVPKLDRFAPFDNTSRRLAVVHNNVCTKIEGAFGEIITNQIAIAAAQTAVSTKNTVFVQTTAPTANATNDLWIDSDDGNKPYRWNGSAWVEVQDLGAALAIGSINLDGTIADDKVVNDSVLAGEIIGADATYTTTSTSISTGTSGPFNTYVEVADKSFTSTGREVQIAVAARIEVLDNCKIIYRLLCDGVQVEDEIGPVTVNAGDQAPLSFIWAHTPAAAAHTYSLEVQVNNNGITVHNPLIGPSENRNL